MRKIREALSSLDLPSDTLLVHGNQRVLYGVPLARNFRDVLLGLAERPSYLLDSSRPSDGTELLAAHWRQRWLAARIERPGILDAVGSHRVTYPVTHGARVASVEPTQEHGDQLPLFSG
jgi:hypothetical protein